MSLQALTAIVERASADAAFREQLQREPETALRGYDLTAEERSALVRGDHDHLESLGLDARITKQAIYIDPASQGSFASGFPN